MDRRLAIFLRTISQPSKATLKQQISSSGWLMLEIDSVVTILFPERITFNPYLIVIYTIYNHIYTTSYSILNLNHPMPFRFYWNLQNQPLAFNATINPWINSIISLLFPLSSSISRIASSWWSFSIFSRDIPLFPLSMVYFQHKPGKFLRRTF